MGSLVLVYAAACGGGGTDPVHVSGAPDGDLIDAGGDALASPDAALLPDGSPSLDATTAPDASHPSDGAAGDTGHVGSNDGSTSTPDGAADALDLGDAGVNNDAAPMSDGATTGDATTGAPDGSTMDAAGPGTDATVGPVDGGADSGTAPTDAGVDTATPPVDSGYDAGSSPVDSGYDAGYDAGGLPVDSGYDSGPPACTHGAQCTTASAGAGICDGDGGCAACNTDPDCTSAYAGGYICVGGSCVVGNCHGVLNCITLGDHGWVCTNNLCAACASTNDCLAPYGSNYVCSSAGQCEVPCLGGSKGSACDNGTTSAAICCPTDVKTLACTAGNCCSNSDCGFQQSCNSGTCTACPVVTDGHYYVDPYSGSDNQNGGGTTCPFQTLTKALGVAAGQDAGVTVSVLPTATLGSLEGFPIVIPAHVTVVGELSDAGAPPVLQIPLTAAYGVELSAPYSGITVFNLQPASGTGTSLTQAAVEILTGSGGAGVGQTQISHVTISGMPNTAIAASSSAVIGPGVILSGNGLVEGAKRTVTANGLGSGLTVTAGAIELLGGSGAQRTEFLQNGEYGIYVTGRSSVSFAGSTKATVSASEVLVDQNNFGGIFVQPSGGGTPGTSTLNGIAVTRTKNGNGISLYAGAAFNLRNSYIGANSQSGIYVTNITGTDVSTINLGSTGSAGNNTIQETNGVAGNSAAGLCMTFVPTLPLAARGNVWGAGGTKVDCNSSSQTLNVLASCSTFADFGYTARLGGRNPNVNVLADATGCNL